MEAEVYRLLSEVTARHQDGTCRCVIYIVSRWGRVLASSRPTRADRILLVVRPRRGPQEGAK